MRICGSADFRMYKRRRSTCDLADLTPSACIDTGQAATPGQKQRPYDSCSMMLCLAACPYTMDGIRQPSSAKTGTVRRTGKVSMGVVRTTYLIDEQGIIIKANDKVKAADDPENMLKELV